MDEEDKNLIIGLILVILVAIALVGFAYNSSAKTNPEDNLLIRSENPTRITTHIPLYSSKPFDRIPVKVNVIVEECNGITGICYSDTQNITMKNRGSGNYQIFNLELKHSDATYMNCRVIILKNDGIWYEYMNRMVNIIG